MDNSLLVGDFSKISAGLIRALLNKYDTYLLNGIDKKEALKLVWESSSTGLNRKEIEDLIERYEEFYIETLDYLKKLENNSVRESDDNSKLGKLMALEKVVSENKINYVQADKNTKDNLNKVQALLKVDEFTKTTTESLIELLVKEVKILEIVKGNRNQLREELEELISNMVMGEAKKTNTIETLIRDKNGKDLSEEIKLKIETVAKTVDVMVDNWTQKESDLVNILRKDRLEELITNKMNKGLTAVGATQNNSVWQYSKLVSEVYYFHPDDNKQKKEVTVAATSQGLSEGQIEVVWDGVKVMSSILKMSPRDLRGFINRYKSIKSKIDGQTLPIDIKQVRAFENMISYLSDNPKEVNLINFTQKYVKFFDRLNWVKRDVVRMGNQTMTEFMSNSLNVFSKQGFKKGASVVFKQIVGGGVKATAGAAEAGGMAGLVGAQAVPVLGQILLALAVAYTGYKKFIQPILNKFKEILKSVGIDLTGMKTYLQENFGKFLGGIMNFGIKAVTVIIAIPTAIGASITGLAIGPIIAFVFVGIFVYSTLTSSLMSSLVPPVRIGNSSLGDIVDVVSDLPDSCPSIWPVSSGCITNGANSIWTHAGRQAIDVGCVSRFQPFYATHDGLAKPFFTAGCGYGVDVYGTCNGVQFYTHYCHGPYHFLSGPTEVKKGQQIGIIDNKGISTGDHLHYDLKNLGDINNYLPRYVKPGCIGFAACGSIRINSVNE